MIQRCQWDSCSLVILWVQCSPREHQRCCCIIGCSNWTFPPPQKILKIILAQRRTTGTAVFCEATVAQSVIKGCSRSRLAEARIAMMSVGSSCLGPIFSQDRRAHFLIFLPSPISPRLLPRIIVLTSKEGHVYSEKKFEQQERGCWPGRSDLLCKGCGPWEHTLSFQISLEEWESFCLEHVRISHCIL